MATIKEIAQRAGVSTTTVSNVIHGKTKKVSPANIEKIENLIREMGYVQKMGLRVLNKEKSQLIAVVINYHKDFKDSVIGDPFYGKIIGFIEKYVQELGYYLMLYSAKDTDKIFQMVMGWDVDGVIAISFSKSNCEKIYQLINKPIVSIDAYGELDAGQENHVLNIGLDDESGGYLMTKYLLECGYEHIQVCAGRDNGVDHFRYMGAQRAGYLLSMILAFILLLGKKQKVQFTALGMNYAKRKESYAWLIQRKKPKTALFFLSDLYALEAISFFSSRGVKIPEEIGIAGYDNISYAEFSVPRLTTISQNVEQKASLAVEILMERINGVEKERENEIELPVTLIPRKSLQPQEEEK